MASFGLHAQDTPPSVYFPTSQEENVVNPELRHWSPPRNLWPEQPGDTLSPDLIEDPQNRVETKYTSDPDVDVKPKEVRGDYTDADENFMQPYDGDNDRPAELWPSQTVETGGAAATQTVEYSDKVQYNSPGGATGAMYADPIPATPNRGDVQPTTYYLTKSEEELFQADTIGETSEALWSEELWSPDRVNSPYDAVPGLFQPLDEVFRAVSWGPSWSGNRARERYWNAQRYNSTSFFENEAQYNNYYRGVSPDANMGRFNRRGGLYADIGNTYGERNRFTYEGTAGLGAGLSPLSFRRYVSDPIFRVGPLVLDNLSLSGSLLYTDFNGELGGEPVDDEGFIGIISLSGSLLLQLTENFYLTASGSFYYLPFTGDVGFSVGDGLGGALNLDPITFARLSYEFELFNWDWMLYDEFAVGHDNHGNLYYNLGAVGSDGGEDRVGRYAFGNPARSTSVSDAETGGEFALDAENFVFRNSVGLMGTGYIVKDWRGIADIHRSDYWYWEDRNEDASGYNELKLRADYVNPVSRWHPYAEYTFGSDDDFDDMRNTFRVGTFLEITENLQADASLGYFWTTGDDTTSDDSWLWELGLYHRINQYMNHTLRGGTVYYRDAILGESYLSSYIRYSYYWDVTPYDRLNLFAQYAENNNIDFIEEKRNTFTAGGTWWHKLHDHADLYATAFYFTNDYDQEARGRTDGITLEAGIQTQLRPRWYFDAFYRYTDQEGSVSSETFTEHLVLATLTRRF